MPTRDATPRHRIRRTLSTCLGLAGAAALALALSGCPRDRAESKQPTKAPPVPVSVAAVEQKAMPVQIQAIGTVEAYSVVSVRAQVGGELTHVHFKEGQDVKKGDLLFTIDPRPFEAALAQAQANVARDAGLIRQAQASLDRDRAKVSQTQAALARDQAQAKNAEVEATRYAELLKRGLIAQEQADQFRTTAESLSHTVLADDADIKSAEETVRADEAAVNSAQQAVRADEAAVDNAKIQLSYTTISSPIDGRTGSLMLHEGNIVRSGGTSDSTLVVINQIQPIYVSFTVPQQQLPVIKRYMAAEGRLEARALPAGEQQPLKGTVTFIDNAVDQATGTIRLKATFGNEERRLWPGQFVNVDLTLTIDPQAIVVPSAALQNGQQGPYVFVVKDDSTVDMRRVTVKRTQGSESVIADGLKAGESVVVDGQPRLVAGARVEVRRPGRPGESAPRGPATPRAPAAKSS